MTERELPTPGEKRRDNYKMMEEVQIEEKHIQKEKDFSSQIFNRYIVIYELFSIFPQ